MKQLLRLFCLLGFFQLNAQPYGDCFSPLFICDKQTIHIGGFAGAGSDNTELNGATCFLNGIPGNIESNSCWIRFSAAQSGILFFTITPDTIGDDIDFVLFQLGNDGTCQQKQVLRCMAAGMSSGVDSSPCLGPTGLMPGETDTTEDAGCTDLDDNNFLAPVYLSAGTAYALCIQNFSSLNGLRVEFCGTALLGCETDTCAALSAVHTPVRASYRLHKLFPNPVFNSRIMLDMETEEAGVMEFTCINVLGQRVRAMQRFIPDGRSMQEFPLDHLQAGAYWLQVTNGQALITRQIWIGNTSD